MAYQNCIVGEKAFLEEQERADCARQVLPMCTECSLAAMTCMDLETPVRFLSRKLRKLKDSKNQFS